LPLSAGSEAGEANRGRAAFDSALHTNTATWDLFAAAQRDIAQVAKDHNVSIEAVSRALGHRTTRTTELYYGRIRTESALAEFEQAFATPAVRVSK